MHITPEEYQRLPASVQKKYFSSVERLRILQQTASEKRSRQSLPTRSQLSIDASSRPRTAHALRSPSVRTIRRSPITPVIEDVNEDQAVRFLALPDKVKRTHFSEEELVLLTESSQRTLASRPHSNVSQWPGTVRTMSIASSTSLQIPDVLEGSDRRDADVRSIMSAVVGGSEPDLTETWPGISSIARSAYASTSAIDLTRLPTPKRTFSKRRALTLAPLPLPPPTLLPPVPALPSPRSDEHTAIDSPTAEHAPSTKAEFYKDAQARSTLRAFLASPEKFDEAVEFGFPMDVPGKDAKHHARSTDSVMKSIYTDEDLLEEDEGTLTDSSCIDSPESDGSSSFETPHGSLDSGVVMQHHKVSARSVTPDLDGRQMTLRLTLTRRELRAPEEQLYAVQRTQVSGVDVETNDPLALGSLQFCDDHSGKHGAFAIANRRSRNGLKRLWSSVRKL